MSSAPSRKAPQPPGACTVRTRAVRRASCSSPSTRRSMASLNPGLPAGPTYVLVLWRASSSLSARRTDSSTGVSPRSSRYTPTPRSTLRGSGSARNAAMRPRIGSGMTGSSRSNMLVTPRQLLARQGAECPLASRLELIAGLPRRHDIGLRDEPRGQHIELRVLNHAVEVPAAVELVGRLMVFLQLPLLDLRAAPVCGAADEVRASCEKQCRYADLGERELVGAVVVAAVGELIGLQHPSLGSGDAAGDLIERGLAHADQGRITGAAEDVAAVDIDVRRDPAGRERGMLRVVPGAEQPALLAGDEQRQHRAARPLVERGKR